MRALRIPSPVSELHHPEYTAAGIRVFLKRDDLIDPEISGNKWRKLKFNLEKFRTGGYEFLLTFGGAYSNHIAATAAVAHDLGIKSIGIIRGDELNETSNATLKTAHEKGMTLVFVSREIYEQRYERIYHEELRREFGHVLIIPEGGANSLGVFGVAEIPAELEREPDHIFTASGTGTTAAGLLQGSSKSIVHAVPVLKGGEFLKEEIRKLLYECLFDEDAVEDLMKRLELHTDAHFGGYGKAPAELLSFIREKESQLQVPFDQVYTGKMLFAFEQALKSGSFKPGETVLLLHTGGLQGRSVELES